MEIRPILSTLMRHKIAALLIVLEIALTCAIVCNALFLIGERLDRMNKPSGIAENELVRIQAASLRQLSGDDDLNKSVTREYLDVLRKVPGVRQAAFANQIPFGGSSNNSGVQLTPEQQHSSLNAIREFPGSPRKAALPARAAPPGAEVPVSSFYGVSSDSMLRPASDEAVATAARLLKKERIPPQLAAARTSLCAFSNPFRSLIGFALPSEYGAGTFATELLLQALQSAVALIRRMMNNHQFFDAGAACNFGAVTPGAVPPIHMRGIILRREMPVKRQPPYGTRLRAQPQQRGPFLLRG